MSKGLARVSVPMRVGLGAVAWGLLLLVAWAIHPVEGVARFVPIQDPSPAEQVSIDEFFDDPEVRPSDQVVRFQCDSSPLGVVAGDGATSAAPVLMIGFEYEDRPCSQEYGAARTVLWVNVLVIAVAVVASAVAHARLRNRPDSDGLTADAKSVVARSDA